MRSALFVPANAPGRYEGALASGAEAVIFDLEDAVGPEEKDSARRTLVESESLGSREPGVVKLIRVNSPATAAGREDLEAMAGTSADAVVVPKADPGAVAAAAVIGLPLVALVETAAGVLTAAETAAQVAVCLLMLGAIDLGAELGIEESDDGDELLAPRSQLVLASAAAGLAPPLDSPCIVPRDSEPLERQSARARRLGFGGKACIHPAQVETVNAAFAPSPAEVDWARRVVDASAAAGGGVALLDGRMIDRPVVLRARKILSDDERNATR